MNVKVSFRVEAQAYEVERIPTSEELSEALSEGIRCTLISDYGFDQASVYDIMEVIDEN